MLVRPHPSPVRDRTWRRSRRRPAPGGRLRHQRRRDLHHERRAHRVERSSSPRPSRRAGQSRPLRLHRADGHPRRGDRAQAGDVGSRRTNVSIARSRTWWRAANWSGKATASRSRWRRSTRRGRPRPPAPSAWHARPTSTHATTSPSASRFGGSAPTRASASVDMATKIEAARLLVWQAAWTKRVGREATAYSSMAKRFAADTAMEVTTDAVDVFGGYGYMTEYPGARSSCATRSCSRSTRAPRRSSAWCSRSCCWRWCHVRRRGQRSPVERALVQQERRCLPRRPARPRRGQPAPRAPGAPGRPCALDRRPEPEVEALQVAAPA